MNERRKTVFKWVTGTHMAVLLLLLLVPWFKGCLHRKPKIIATFDLSAPPPPLPEVAPEPVPEPAPKPKPIPLPPKTNALPKVVKSEPKKIEPKKTEPKKPEPKKAEPKEAEPKPAPKLTEAQRLAAIRQNKKVTNPNASSVPVRPELDFSGIQSALNDAATHSGTTYGSGSGSGGGAYSPFAGYYDSVKQRMYAVWQQPSGAPIGLSATATIRVERDGTVSSKTITRRSGNTLFDQSVQSALNATAWLPVPPADLPSRDIEIEFLLSN